jgi:hypothetical protein
MYYRNFFRNNITRLIDSWETLKKSKNKDSKAADKSREEFKKKGEQVFWIGKDNIKEILKKTSLDKLSYYVDIKFLKDQKSSRLMTLGSKDMRYKTVNKDKKPLKSCNIKQLPQIDESTTDLELLSDISDVSTESDISFDLLQPGPSNAKQELRKGFVKDIAMTSVSKNISSRDLVHVCTDLIVSSGGNVANFSVSHSTIWRAQKKSIRENAEQYKKNVKIATAKATFPIIAHFDGKIIEDITEGIKSKRDRFAVSVNIDGKMKLLGIPAIDRGTGQAQYDALVKILDEYGICDDVKGLCFDTTATNTGRLSGTNVRFSHKQNSILLELACRRHVYELHLKHFCERQCSGKTKSPENLMFKRFQLNWNDIKSSIDSSKFVKHDTQSIATTFLEIHKLDAVKYCEIALKKNTFPRGDYKELLKLTLMYLCPERDFKIQAPGCVSHARFMSKAIYYLKIQILSLQLSYELTDDQKNEVQSTAEFISIFYTVWFLKTSLPYAAPYQDIKAYWQMTKYRCYVEQYVQNSETILNGIDATMVSMESHLWYLDETLIPLALLDQGISVAEREDVAKMLFSKPVPEFFRHSEKLNLLKTLNFNLEKPPSIAQLVGENSWFIFSLLNLTKLNDKLWLNSPAPLWEYIEQFKIFSQFVSNLAVVNDVSERSIKVVSDFVNNVHNEDDCQELLLAIHQRRENLNKAKTKEDLQLAYQAIAK